MMGQSHFDNYLGFFHELKKMKNQVNYFPHDREYVQINKYELNCQLFLIRDDTILDSILDGGDIKTRDYRFEWEVEKKNEGFARIIMNSKSNFQITPQTDYFYFIFSKRDMFLLPIGYIESNYLKKRIFSFLKEFFPQISMSFLSQKEIKDFLNLFLKNSNLETTLEMLVYRKVSKDKKTKRKSIQKAVDYIEANIDTRISELESDKKYVDTIGINVYNSLKSQHFKFKYNRNNRILWSGDDFFYLIEILNKIYQISVQKFKFLDNRERKYTQNHRSKPFILKLNTDFFSTREKIKDFHKKVSKFPKCNHAIIHSGNPLIHIILRDQSDNSIYSIKNISNKDLMISPQIIGSNSSLFRILNLISETVSEFEIIDYEDYRKEFHTILNLKSY